MIQFTNCKACGKMYMVGFMGKDVRETKMSGGECGGVPFVAIGNGELDQNPPIKEGDVIPCPGCGEVCIVEEGKPIDRKD